eukprot:gene25703-34278_t
MINSGTVDSLTVSKAAWLLAAFPYSAQWKDIHEFNYLNHAVSTGLQEAKKQHSGPTSSPELVDPRSPIAFSVTSSPVVAIYTDYPVARDVLSRSSSFKLVDTSDEAADFLLVTAHIRDFLSLSPAQRVCQFPYEGGLVRKDLLLLTVPRHCGGPTGDPPEWWLPCFDVSTQFHLFADFYRQSSSAGRVGSWIMKPSQGTRGKGHRVFPAPSLNRDQAAVVVAESDSEEREALKNIALASPLLANAARHLPQRESRADNDEMMDSNGQDYIIQLLVERPLLVKGRKFDLRLFVFVRSFSPFEAYMHELFYARLANKPYDLTQLCDSEISLTVSAYHRDKSVSAKQERLLAEDLQTCLCMEDPLFSYPDMLQKEDRSSDNGRVISPKLLEVNFMGDWLGVKNTLAERYGHDSEEVQARYQQWAEDMLCVLATSVDLTAHPRLKRLDDPKRYRDDDSC